MATRDELFVYVMHRFSEAFEEHAVLKGGMALRLLDSPRSTTDLDYVFVPYDSKKALVDPILEALEDRPEGLGMTHTLHSKMLRIDLVSDDTAIQVEVSAASQCPSIPMSTGALARTSGRPAQIVRVMDFAVALAHKLAAWNERRLERDLFDCYFLFGPVGAAPDLETLDLRLASMQSKLPKLKKQKRMTRSEFADDLSAAVEAIDQAALDQALGPLLPAAELAGLALRMQAQLRRLVEVLRAG